LIRLWRNAVAPVNRIPPEILVLVPDFWDKDYDDGDQDVVALTHVCRAWREVFISRSSLWINLDCEDEDKTRVYLERSKSLPINLSLHANGPLSSYHPFFKIVPHAIGRLKSLDIDLGMVDFPQDIADPLSRSAPLLEELSIRGAYDYAPNRNPVLPPTLFNGDLSSLRELKLGSVHTELRWRNMVNLTSIMLARMSWGNDSVEQLLDFFESAPHLRKVQLLATLTSNAQNGRLVSLACLRRMEITGGGSASPLLDHLLIPVGANLKIEVELPCPPIEDHPPRFLDNLRNLPNFTDIYLLTAGYSLQVQFSGPNGQVRMISRRLQSDNTGFVLDHFDTSKVERLKIDRGIRPSSGPLHRALLPMKHLRTLTLHHFASPDLFVYALLPDSSLSGDVVCPELEELVIAVDDWAGYMKSVIEVMAARASRGLKLKSVRIFAKNQPARTDVLELEKHVSDVECGPEADETDDEDDDIDEED
jgi:hypothetical protein